MKNKLLLILLIVCAILTSCTQNQDNNSTEEAAVADPILPKYKKYFEIYSLTADTISKYYNIKVQIIGSTETNTVKIGKNQYIGATKNNDFKFKIWLSEIDDKTPDRLETGYESNTIPISVTADSYSKNPKAHIELQEVNNEGRYIMSVSKPASDRIVIGAGHPFDGKK